MSKITKTLSCFVIGCNTTESNNPKNLSFYRISPAVKEKWCKIICRNPNNCDEEYICSKHFLKSDFAKGKVTKTIILKPEAVPSQKLDYIKINDKQFVSVDLSKIEKINVEDPGDGPPTKRLEVSLIRGEADITNDESNNIKICKVKKIDKQSLEKRVIQIYNIPSAPIENTEPKDPLSLNDSNDSDVEFVDTTKDPLSLDDFSPSQTSTTKKNTASILKKPQSNMKLSNMSINISKTKQKELNKNKLLQQALIDSVTKTATVRLEDIMKQNKIVQNVQVKNLKSLSNEKSSAGASGILKGILSTPENPQDNVNSRKIAAIPLQNIVAVKEKPNLNITPVLQNVQKNSEKNTPVLQNVQKSSEKSTPVLQNVQKSSEKKTPVLQNVQKSSEKVSSTQQFYIPVFKLQNQTAKKSSDSSQKPQQVIKNIANDTESKNKKLLTSILKSRNDIKNQENGESKDILKSFKDPLTNEKIDVVFHTNPNNNKTSKPEDENKRIANALSKTDDSDQYILIKPGKFHSITPEKIQACIDILTDKYNIEEKILEKCKNCENLKNNHTQEFNKLNKTHSTMMDIKHSESNSSTSNSKLEKRVRDQANFIKAARYKIQKLHNKIDQLENILEEHFDILDKL